MTVAQFDYWTKALPMTVTNRLDLDQINLPKPGDRSGQIAILSLDGIEAVSGFSDSKNDNCRREVSRFSFIVAIRPAKSVQFLLRDLPC